MSDKVCTDCGGTFPLSHDHWRQKKDGKWDVRCLICRAKVNRGKRARRKEKDSLAIEQGALNTFLNAARQGGDNVPHSSELLERLMEYFGGTSGFSAMLVKQYFDSAPGGATRTKMLDSMVRLVVKNTDMGGAKKPLGQWTDDELEVELDSRLLVLAKQFQGRIVNGTIAQEASGPAGAAVGLEDGELPGIPAKRNTGRARRSKNRGLKALPADPSAGGDARLQGK
jgi:hypothetical protein